MTNQNYEHRYGMRVHIVGGLHKSFEVGTHLGPNGKKSARICVDGDKVQERCLRLSSIEPHRNAGDRKDDSPTVALSKQEHKELVDELSLLTTQVQKLTLKVQQLEYT